MLTEASLRKIPHLGYKPRVLSVLEQQIEAGWQIDITGSYELVADLVRITCSDKFLDSQIEIFLKYFEKLVAKMYEDDTSPQCAVDLIQKEMIELGILPD